MIASKITRYDDLDVFVVIDPSAQAAGRELEIPHGLSVAWVLGDHHEWRIPEIEVTATGLIRSAPVLVHCFGRVAEVAHDIIDERAIAAGHLGLATRWSESSNVADILFELFRTDLPPEDRMESWRGRLLVLDRVSRNITEGVLEGLQNVDAVIARLLREEEPN